VHVSKRPATTEDYDLARKWHHEGFRDVVIRQFGTWDEARQDGFFADAWAPEATEIIIADGVECGYCVVELRDNAMHLVDLVISPAYQGLGIGTAILTNLQHQAATMGVPIHLRVLHANRAKELYARRGFRLTGQTETHMLMSWSASQQ
jgi:ribosomal protein S18 acetylase RimI-like enzyme